MQFNLICNQRKSRNVGILITFDTRQSTSFALIHPFLPSLPPLRSPSTFPIIRLKIHGGIPQPHIHEPPIFRLRTFFHLFYCWAVWLFSHFPLFFPSIPILFNGQPSYSNYNHNSLFFSYRFPFPFILLPPIKKKCYLGIATRHDKGSRSVNGASYVTVEEVVQSRRR